MEIITDGFVGFNKKRGVGQFQKKFRAHFYPFHGKKLCFHGEWQAKIFHFMYDCVFSGNKIKPKAFHSIGKAGPEETINASKLSFHTR